MKYLLVSVTLLLGACSATPAGEWCYKNKVYYPNDSKICGDVKLITIRDGGVNLEAINEGGKNDFIY